jgi:hypothetical protein
MRGSGPDDSGTPTRRRISTPCPPPSHTSTRPTTGHADGASWFGAEVSAVRTGLADDQPACTQRLSRQGVRGARAASHDPWRCRRFRRVFHLHSGAGHDRAISAVPPLHRTSGVSNLTPTPHDPAGPTGLPDLASVLGKSVTNMGLHWLAPVRDLPVPSHADATTSRCLLPPTSREPVGAGRETSMRGGSGTSDLDPSSVAGIV